MPQSKEILTKDYWNNAAYSFGTDKVSNGAIFESIQSQLPGRSNGPADAYRHLLLAAEMTRKMGVRARCLNFKFDLNKINLKNLK
jgi:hypothetical protein